MPERQIHDRGNGTYDPDRLLVARTAALHEAVRLELGLAGVNVQSLTQNEAGRVRAVVETSAARLERWLLRAPVDPEDEAEAARVVADPPMRDDADFWTGAP